MRGTSNTGAFLAPASGHPKSYDAQQMALRTRSQSLASPAVKPDTIHPGRTPHLRISLPEVHRFVADFFAEAVPFSSLPLPKLGQSHPTNQTVDEAPVTRPGFILCMSTS